MDSHFRPMGMPEKPISVRADEVYFEAFDEIAGNMNRKARRTEVGRRLVAEARAKALKAKVEFLEAKLAELEGGAA